MSPKVLLCGEMNLTRDTKGRVCHDTDIVIRPTGNVDKNIVWAQKEVEQELAAVAEVLVSVPLSKSPSRIVYG